MSTAGTRGKCARWLSPGTTRRLSPAATTTRSASGTRTPVESLVLTEDTLAGSGPSPSRRTAAGWHRRGRHGSSGSGTQSRRKALPGFPHSFPSGSHSRPTAASLRPRAGRPPSTIGRWDTHSGRLLGRIWIRADRQSWRWSVVVLDDAHWLAILTKEGRRISVQRGHRPPSDCARSDRRPRKLPRIFDGRPLSSPALAGARISLRDLTNGRVTRPPWDQVEQAIWTSSGEVIAVRHAGELLRWGPESGANPDTFDQATARHLLAGHITGWPHAGFGRPRHPHGSASGRLRPPS